MEAVLRDEAANFKLGKSDVEEEEGLRQQIERQRQQQDGRLWRKTPRSLQTGRNVLVYRWIKDKQDKQEEPVLTSEKRDQPTGISVLGLKKKATSKANLVFQVLRLHTFINITL